jgi:aldose 1-epimerase
MKTSLLAALLCAVVTLPAHSSVTRSAWGKSPDGQTVDLYRLRNAAGMEVSLATWGAMVVDLKVPDRNGAFADVSLGFTRLEPYFTQSPYFGCATGRYANRIAKGRFTLDGKTYQLATNNAPNHLHGGKRGFDKRVWTAKVISSGDEPAIEFSRRSPDGEEGYPGNLDVKITYTLRKNNTLRIDYEAVTDQATIINLTNHTYFNLAGAGSGTIRSHLLRIKSGKFTPVDATLIPTGELKSVDGTPMDFRAATAIGARLEAVGGTPVGYDHNYVLNKSFFGGMRAVAELYEPKSGRLMTVHTDQPGIQFYSGNFLDGTVRGKGGVYRQWDGLCLETQHFPDSPNQPNFPSTVLRPGQTYRTSTAYSFSTK